MANQSKHTPQWGIEDWLEMGFDIVDRSGRKRIIATVAPGPEAKDLAELIVRAVNSHAELLAALKAIMEPVELEGPFAMMQWIRRMRTLADAAIAKAEPVTPEREP